MNITRTTGRVLSSYSALAFFKFGADGYKELAKHTVAETPTRATPIVSGESAVLKDRDTLMLRTID